MKIVVSGASGLIGGALVRGLRTAGHDVRRLVRQAAVAAPDEILWSPAAGELNPQDLRGTDAIINLAGENVGHRWTPARRDRILRSRVDSTKTLVAAIAALKPAPSVFLSASAVGYYGDRGEETLTEASSIGHGFLPEVCLAWETHAQGAAPHGVRTVMLRFGTVLAGEGGALAKMLPLFRLGLGGRLGNGEQWMSWVSLDDVVGAAMHALRDARCAGPMNITAPTPVRNRDFTAALGRILHRPAVLPAPAWALRMAFGEMADEALLASARALPKRLTETGYMFLHPALEGALEAALRG